MINISSTDLWGSAIDEIRAIERDAVILTNDQRIQIVLALSMLAVAQEVSTLRDIHRTLEEK